MPTDQTDPHRRIDGLQHEFNMLQTTTKAEIQSAKSESAISYERLLAAIERQGKQMERRLMEMIVAVVIIVGVGVAFLGFLFTALDRNSQSPPAIYYQPPAASVLPDPN